ncbi:MAG: hypothetical protein K5985_07940, partial [Lachnospiraceae bacterium]|nr:hypothetical protein [Lachnospiraceae bacterium]
SEGIKTKVPFIVDASDGILIGKELTSGWDKIDNEAFAAASPAEIKIDMNGATVVPLELLNGISERDVTCYFIMDDNVTWAVNGLSFTENIGGDVDFRVRMDTKNIPAQLINEVADVYPHTNISLEHNGTFGFTAVMDLELGDDKAGQYGNLYFYDEGAGGLEYVDASQIKDNGRAEFTFTHASDYTVIVRSDAMTEKTAGMQYTDDSASSGSGSGSLSGGAGVTKKKSHWWIILISVLCLLLCGMILFMPDRRARRGQP